MPCFVDESSWECREDCERKCKNDHECSKMCFEDCTQCDVIFLRKVTKCGHDQLIPCFMEESQWKCNAYCEKKCKNNHRCKKLCSEDCGNCTVELIIEMVGCGHFQTVPCYIEPGDWKCTVPCEGILECGHKCQSLCADAIHNLYCTKVKSKYDRSAVISDCQIPVVKTIPGCGHEQTMPCFQEPLKWDSNAKCEKVCKTIILARKGVFKTVDTVTYLWPKHCLYVAINTTCLVSRMNRHGYAEKTVRENVKMITNVAKCASKTVHNVMLDSSEK